MPSNLLDFTGKVVLITGGATGIGRATAIAFAKQGAKVVIGDLNDEAARTVEMIRSAGGDALFVRADVSRDADVRELVERTLSTYKGLHCAFNNAGVLPRTMPLGEMDEATFDRTIGVDLKGVYLCMKHEINHMLRAGGGAIVNTASIAGIIGYAGISSYVAAKHGVIGLTRTAALEYADKGIRINVLAPGIVETPMTADWLADPAKRAALLAGPAMKRAGTPEEMTGIVLYLCSPLASFTTGQSFIIDGGQTAR